MIPRRLPFYRTEKILGCKRISTTVYSLIIRSEHENLLWSKCINGFTRSRLPRVWRKIRYVVGYFRSWIVLLFFIGLLFIGFFLLFVVRFFCVVFFRFFLLGSWLFFLRILFRWCRILFFWRRLFTSLQFCQFCFKFCYLFRFPGVCKCCLMCCIS